MDKNDMTSLCRLFESKLKKYPRAESRLVKVFDKYYFKKMTREELEQKRHKVWLFNDSVKGEKDLV